jgi:hypothetical protein
LFAASQVTVAPALVVVAEAVKRTGEATVAPFAGVWTVTVTAAAAAVAETGRSAKSMARARRCAGLGFMVGSSSRCEGRSAGPAGGAGELSLLMHGRCRGRGPPRGTGTLTRVSELETGAIDSGVRSSSAAASSIGVPAGR